MVEMVRETNVRVPMRDGVMLAADVWRPDGDAPVPALLARTPYGRVVGAAGAKVEELAAAGYAVVFQDSRGRFDSDGEWQALWAEVDDGYDTVEWIAAQPWCDGQVGMFGASYLGFTQWVTAIDGPPHLVTIFPEACLADAWTSPFDAGGAFRLGSRVGWAALVASQVAAIEGWDTPLLAEMRELALVRGRAVVAADAAGNREGQEALAKLLADAIRHRPIGDNPLFAGRVGFLADIFGHERRDDAAWAAISPVRHYHHIDLPAVHVGGWYDLLLQGILTNFQEMRRQAPSERARANQHLIVGPWVHWSTWTGVAGDVDFGPEAVWRQNPARIAWFDHWMKDGPDPALPPVRIFVMGENVWRDEQEWPLARTDWQRWYLHADGRLDTSWPDEETADAYRYDPRDPMPALGGRLLGTGEVSGAFDQRPVLDRDDVLVYRSDELTAALELTGPVTLELWASSSAPDTDFVAKLLDIHPDGRAVNVCEGVVRARHAGLNGPMQPGAVYRFTVDLLATSIVLPVGHRVGLLVSSSAFPTWEPNPNTGHPIGVDTDADLRVADQAVHHDRLHPTHLVLPVIPR